jgi:hypothetical protein
MHKLNQSLQNSRATSKVLLPPVLLSQHLPLLWKTANSESEGLFSRRSPLPSGLFITYLLLDAMLPCETKPFDGKPYTPWSYCDYRLLHPLRHGAARP